VTRELVDKADALAEPPRLGRVVPELGDENVREIPAYSYYEIKPGDDIIVHAVIHKRRDLRPDEVL
jgi:toxin ParE1/3/4